MIGSLLLLTLWAGIPTIPAPPQTPIATAADSLRVDLLDADVLATAVTRIEFCYDAQTGAACTNVTPAASKFTPTTAQGGTPPIGFSAYKSLVPALAAANHTVAIRACNASDCSAPTTLSFRYAIVPQPPSNPQFIKGS